MHIGIISDTHNLLRPEVFSAFQGVDQIIHVGDVCEPGIIAKLADIAPICGVRGNCDRDAWAELLPTSDTWQFAGLSIHGVHIREDLDLDPAAAGISLVLNGHTHQPSREEIDGVTYFNPGSAGPHRLSLPVTLAHLHIDGSSFRLEWWDLKAGKSWSLQ